MERKILLTSKINFISQKGWLKNLVVVADAGLLSDKNSKDLCDLKYEFILGGRIKNVSKELKRK